MQKYKVEINGKTYPVEANSPEDAYTAVSDYISTSKVSEPAIPEKPENTAENLYRSGKSALDGLPLIGNLLRRTGINPIDDAQKEFQNTHPYHDLGSRGASSIASNAILMALGGGTPTIMSLVNAADKATAKPIDETNISDVALAAATGALGAYGGKALSGALPTVGNAAGNAASETIKGSVPIFGKTIADKVSPGVNYLVNNPATRATAEGIVNAFAQSNMTQNSAKSTSDKISIPDQEYLLSALRGTQ